MLADSLASWRDFYSLLGTASATMIGLLFVAASVGTGVFSTDRRAPLRVFLTASVVHFGSVLAVCLTLMTPLRSPVLLGSLVSAGGVFGFGYCCIAWIDTVRDGMSKRIDLEDRTWYSALPIVSYLLEIGSGVALALQCWAGWPSLAGCMGALMVIGIHNAWDITIWSIGRRRE